MEVHTDRGEGGREGGKEGGVGWEKSGEGGEREEGTAVPVVCDGNKYPTAALGFIYAPSCHPN